MIHQNHKMCCEPTTAVIMKKEYLEQSYGTYTAGFPVPR